jgi:multiple sugar transport system ATP-binding protein
MATIGLEGVEKVYAGGVPAVQDLTLTIERGSFVSLVGPSGCGKSTTLNLIAGLEEATRGTIRIDGVVVNGRSPRERDVAMVFQSYALYPHMTVAENLGFPLVVARLPRAEIGARVRETAALLGLEALLDRRPRALSGGQRQRVALGRALVRRPKLFLFDEPLSNLDAALRTQMRAEIKKLHERLATTFVYVTHDQAEAMTLSDRIVVMNGGRIEQVAAPRELYAAPATTFVASFFGAPRINLLRPETLGAVAPGGAAVKLGLRPEDVEVGLGAPPAGAGDDVVAGAIYLVEPLGAESWVTVEARGERIVARAPGGFAARAGEAAWLRIGRDRLHAFDARTGRRLPAG